MELISEWYPCFEKNAKFQYEYPTNQGHCQTSPNPQGTTTNLLNPILVGTLAELRFPPSVVFASKSPLCFINPCDDDDDDALSCPPKLRHKSNAAMPSFPVCCYLLSRPAISQITRVTTCWAGHLREGFGEPNFF